MSEGQERLDKLWRTAKEGRLTALVVVVQLPDKCTHIFAWEGHWVNCKVPVCVVQVDIVPLDCNFRKH